MIAIIGKIKFLKRLINFHKWIIFSDLFKLIFIIQFFMNLNSYRID